MTKVVNSYLLQITVRTEQFFEGSRIPIIRREFPERTKSLKAQLMELYKCGIKCINELLLIYKIPKMRYTSVFSKLEIQNFQIILKELPTPSNPQTQQLPKG